MSKWLLNCDPRPVQLEALERSYFGADGPKRGWGHFLEMRLGKTPLVLNEFMLYKRDHRVNKCLVLAPNKFKATWVAEALGFGVDVPVMLYDSNKAITTARYPWLNNVSQPGLLVVNYEALRSQRHWDTIIAFARGRYMLVADESALCKSPSATQTRLTQALADDAYAVRLLSGMPAPQAPYDLWSQLRIMGRHRQVGAFQAFKHTYTAFGG